MKLLQPVLYLAIYLLVTCPFFVWAGVESQLRRVPNVVCSYLKRTQPSIIKTTRYSTAELLVSILIHYYQLVSQWIISTRYYATDLLLWIITDYHQLVSITVNYCHQSKASFPCSFFTLGASHALTPSMEMPQSGRATSYYMFEVSPQNLVSMTLREGVLPIIII